MSRRYPNTITRKRETPGDRNDQGQYVPGMTLLDEFRASVQPVSLEDIDAPSGTSLSHRLKLYIPQPDALAAAFDDASADKVLIGEGVDAIEYVVEESQSWPDHTKAIILRET